MAALLFPSSHFASPFAAFADDLDDMLAPPPSLRCYPSACRSAAYGPPATVYRLHRQPSFAPPAEPEVHLRRTDSGVLAGCPLGRAFSSEDISLQVDGRAFVITAFHPGTAHWPRRPAAYRGSLQLAPHIDERRIQARLEDGVLRVFFPFRPRPQPQRLVVTLRAPAPAPAPVQQPLCPRMVLVQGPACPALACGPARVPAAPPAAAPVRAPAACCAPVAAHTAPASAPAVQPAAPAPAAAAPVPPCSFRRAALNRRPARALPAHVKGLHRSSEQEPAKPAAPSVPCCQQPQEQQRQRACAAACSKPAAAAMPQATQQAAQQPRQQQQPRVIPVEGPSSPKAAAASAPSSPKAAAASAPSSPKAAAASAPSSPKAAAASAPSSPKAAAASAPSSPKAAAAADKGKIPASPQQIAAAERRRRAQAAAARIAAGVASDSDYDDADGSVEDCSLDA